MREYRLSLSAEKDVESITEFTVRTWGDDKALAYLTEIEKALHRLVQMPLKGRSREELAMGLRSHIALEHIIYYKTYDDYIDVIRSLHKHMDPSQSLKGDE